MSAVIQEELVSIERAIPMRRVWAMPSPNTFDIPPIRALVKSYLYKSKVSVDPFARNKRWATYTNDLNPETAANHHMEAREFLEMLIGQGIRADLVIFDPPYSPRQVKEVYESVGKHFGIEDQWNTGRWTRERELVSQLQGEQGIAISCGWNSQGIGLQHGYEVIEQVNICHGGAHNDTIVTVERKVETAQVNLFREPEERWGGHMTACTCWFNKRGELIYQESGCPVHTTHTSECSKCRKEIFQDYEGKWRHVRHGAVFCTGKKSFAEPEERWEDK